MLFSAYTEESLSGIGHVVQDIEQVNRHTDGLRNRLSGLFKFTESRFGGKRAMKPTFQADI